MNMFLLCVSLPFFSLTAPAHGPTADKCLSMSFMRSRLHETGKQSCGRLDLVRRRELRMRIQWRFLKHGLQQHLVLVFGDIQSTTI
jgi:hypothetical protein